MASPAALQGGHPFEAGALAAKPWLSLPPLFAILSALFP